eukprot:4334417-Amphidinium_carterae.1
MAGLNASSACSVKVALASHVQSRGSSPRTNTQAWHFQMLHGGIRMEQGGGGGVQVDCAVQ